MALEWGSVSGKMRVGLNTYINSDGGITCSVYISTDSAGYNWTGSDNIDITLNGPGSYDGSWRVNPTLTGSYEQMYVGQVVIPASALNMGQSYSFTASASDLHTGGTPSKTASQSVPSAPPKPSTPTASGITTTGATINWSKPSNATSIQIQVDDSSGFGSTHSDYRDAASPSQPFAGTGSVSSGYIGGNGVAGRTYYARIRGYNGTYGEYGPWSNTLTFRLDSNNPGKAPTPSVTPSTTSLLIDWEYPSSNGGVAFNGMQIQVDDNSNFSSTAADYVDTNGSPAGPGSLNPYTTYYVRVRARNTDGHYGAWSNTVTTRTLANLPGQPTGLSQTNIDTGGADVSWNAPSNWGGDNSGDYDVQWWVTGDYDNTQTVISKANTRTHHITTAPANTNITWRVRAKNSAGAGSWSGTNAFTTAPVTPGSSSNLVATYASDTRINLTWNNTSTASAPVTKVTVQRQTDGGSWTTIATLGGVTSYADTSVSANHEYRYRVRAENSGGASDWAYSNTLVTNPGAPTSVKAARATGGAVKLTWVNTSNIGYTIQIQELSEDGSSWVDKTTVAGGTTTWTDNSPVGGETQYRIRAVSTLDPARTSAWVTSNTVVTITAPAAPQALAPSGVTVDAANDITFTWTHVPIDGSDQTQFQIRHRIVGSDVWTEEPVTVSDVSQWVLTAGTYENGQQIEWQVRTWGAADDPSPWSATAVITLSGTPSVTILEPLDGETHGTSSGQVEWTFFDPEGQPQAAWEARLIRNGFTVEEASGNGAATTYPFTSTLANGSTYTVEVRGQDQDGLWSDWASVTFDVEYLPPAWVDATATYDEDSASVVISLAPQEPVEGVTVEAQYVDIDRSIDGGPWVRLATHIPADSAFVDTTASIHGRNCYRVTVYNDDLPTSRVQDSRTVTCNQFTNSTFEAATDGVPDGFDVTNGTVIQVAHWSDPERFAVAIAGGDAQVDTDGTTTVIVRARYNGQAMTNGAGPVYAEGDDAWVTAVGDGPMRLGEGEWSDLIILSGAYGDATVTEDGTLTLGETSRVVCAPDGLGPVPTEVVTDEDGVTCIEQSCFLIVDVWDEDRGVMTTGDGFDTLVSMMCDLTFATVSSRVKALHHFAGRAWPVELTGESLNHALSVTGTVLGTPQSVADAEEFAYTLGIVLWRDFTGRYMYASIGEVSAQMVDPQMSDMWTLSFTLTRVDENA